MSVPAQIAVLLALTAELFDSIPLDRMTDAEQAVHEAAVQIPAEVCARFETAQELSDEDRKAIIELARQAVAPFQPKPEAKPGDPGQKPDKKSEAEAKGGNKSEPEPKKSAAKSESKPGTEAKSTLDTQKRTSPTFNPSPKPNDFRNFQR